MKTADGVRQAMILAAGKGTRLGKLTQKMPKVLLPLRDGNPLLDYTFLWLKKYGIEEVVINLHHLGYQIRDYAGNEHRGIKITYSPEETLLGTAGGVKRMQHLFKDDFLIIYGDILTDFDFLRMVRFHRRQKSLATIAVIRMENRHDVGVVKLNEKGKIISLIEKPQHLETPSFLANAGIYLMNKKALDYVPEAKFCDFAYDVFPELVRQDLPIYGYELKPDDYLLDIGTTEKYQQAKEDIKAGLVNVK